MAIQNHLSFADAVVCFGELFDGGRVQPEVGGGEEHQLEDEARATLIACHQRDHCRHIAARAVAADRHARGIGAKLCGMLGDPLRRGEAILHRRREGILRREAVVHGDDDAACTVGDAAAEWVLNIQAAHQPRASVQEDEYGKRADTRWRVDAERELAAWAGNLPVLYLGDGFAHGALRLHAFCHFAGEQGIKRVVVDVHRLHHVEVTLGLWIDGHALLPRLTLIYERECLPATRRSSGERLRLKAGDGETSRA